MARKLISGKSVEVKGLRELEAKIRDIMDASKGRKIQSMLGEVAREIRLEVAASAMTRRVPHEVLDDIFSYNKPRPSELKKGKVSALMGIRKKGTRQPWAHAYVEWNPGKSWASVPGGYLRGRGKKILGSKKGLVSGRRIGESLATMFEIGTSKMRARPFFRPVIMRSRAQVFTQIANAYRSIIASHAAK